MANTPVATLVQQVRRYVRDFADQDALTAALTSSATQIQVANTDKYYENELIEIGSENMIVRKVNTGEILTVRRAAYGSTAAVHASGDDILLKPGWTFSQILDALNAAVEAAYPWVYQEVMDTSISIATNTYEYAVPNMPGTYNGDTIFIPRLRGIDILDPGATNTPWIPLSAWDIRRDITAPKIKLGYLENPGATLRVRGYGPFPDLAEGGNLHPAWPRNVNMALVEYAASCLLMSGEAGRLRADAQLLDTREAAQRPGSSLAAANAAEARFQRRLSNAGLSPMHPSISVLPQ